MIKNLCDLIEIYCGHNHAEKRAIARLAAGYIHDGDALAINNGTSNIELAVLLRKLTKI